MFSARNYGERTASRPGYPPRSLNGKTKLGVNAEAGAGTAAAAPARKIAAIPVSTRPRKPNFKRIELYATSFLLSHPVCFAYALTTETGLPGKVVGTIDMRERHLFADVSSEHAAAIIAGLNRGNLKGHRVKVKPA